MPREEENRPIEKIESLHWTRKGPITLMNITSDPSRMAREMLRPSEWKKATFAEKRNMLIGIRSAMGERQYGEWKVMRNAIRSLKRDMPYEAQDISAWYDSFAQNIKGSPKADYHLMAALQGKRFLGWSTAQISRKRADLPFLVALGEYAHLNPSFRNTGIFAEMVKKRFEMARQNGVRYFVSEKDRYTPEDHERFLKLQLADKAGKLSNPQAEELKELHDVRKYLERFSKLGYRKVEGLYYGDVSPVVEFTGEGNEPGVIKQMPKRGFPRYDLWVAPLHKAGVTEISAAEGRNLVKSLLQGPQDISVGAASKVMRAFEQAQRKEGPIPTKYKLVDHTQALNPLLSAEAQRRIAMYGKKLGVKQ